MGSLLSTLSFGQLLLSSVAAYLAYVVVGALHNFFFHPLAKFPGPKLRAAFYFPAHREIIKGDFPFNWHKLHEEYGDIVRVNPNTLSVIKSDAWKDIYANDALIKDPTFYYRGTDGEPADIMSANNADHPRLRRPLNAAFSEQALRSQEGMINSYITLLINKLRSRAESKTPVDIVRWMNFTTFDITGDLAFDETFGSLESEDYDSWIATVFGMFQFASMLSVLKDYPWINAPVMMLFNTVPALVKIRHAHDSYTRDKAGRRLNKKTDRKDFISYILKYNGTNGITDAEIKQTSGTLIIAGSETTATVLSGAFYFLLANPKWMAKLQDELRAAFKDESEITFAALSQLKTLHAIIQETLRMYPPVPGILPRITPPEGATISGTFVPADTCLGMAQYPAFRSTRHFKNPHKFAPERFLGDAEYANDTRSVLQPFSVGSRNCIGQNLAWAELRTIIARLVWNFDMQLEKESENWDHHKVFVLWEKPPLMTRLTARSLSAAA